MDLLKRELARKKREVENQKKQASSGGGDKRFFKANARYEAAANVEADRKDRKRKRTSDEDEGNASKDTATKDKEKVIEDDDLISVAIGHDVARIVRELRQWGLPVRLFGESHIEQSDRWQKAIQHQSVFRSQNTEAAELKLGAGHSIRNPFLGSKTQLDKSERCADGDAKSQSANKRKREEDEKAPKLKCDYLRDYADDPHKLIYRYFKDLLREWEDVLSKCPADTSRSISGHKELQTQKQCRDYIRPLFKLCKKRALDEQVVQALVKIATFCIQGEFVQAHDAYMDLAIGRAAWPIGVTMVGIHARTGRAKIESSNVAHVMNSELQRKYLTSVKRLLTFAQNQRTDVEPSKKVMN